MAKRSRGDKTSRKDDAQEELNYDAILDYPPNYFIDPNATPDVAFAGTLGRLEWEVAAAYVVTASQTENTWTPATNIREKDFPKYGLDEAIKQGLFERTKGGGLMLTNKALDLIEPKYSTGNYVSPSDECEEGEDDDVGRTLKTLGIEAEDKEDSEEFPDY